MGFTRSTTTTNVHSTLGDYPSVDDGLTPEQLKARFDSPATGLKTDLNGLMTELEATTSAESVGAAPMYSQDASAANVQAKLEQLHEEIQDVALNEIPDNSITEAKLNSTYSSTLAKKDGTLQTNLNAEKLGGNASSAYALKNGTLQTNLNAEKLNTKTEAQLKAAFLGTNDISVLSYSGLLAPETAGFANATETKTYTTTGRRYYFIISSYKDCNLILYDAKSGKFVFGSYMGGDVDEASRTFATNTNQLILYSQGGSGNDKATATLTASYSSGTLSLTITKQSRRTSGGTNYNLPAGTLTVFELSGMV